MAEPKAFNDEEIKQLVAEDPHHDVCEDPNDCDWCRLVARITADRKRIKELKEKRTADVERFMGYIKDWGDQKRKFQKRIEELELKQVATQGLLEGKWGYILCINCNSKCAAQRPPSKDTVGWVRMEKLIADQTATIEQLKKDAEIKDSLAEGVMTLVEIHEQLEDAKATITAKDDMIISLKGDLGYAVPHGVELPETFCENLLANDLRKRIEQLQGGMGRLASEPEPNPDPELKPCRECQSSRRIARSYLPQDDSTETRQALDIGKEK